MQSLGDKLQVKLGSEVMLLNAPASFKTLLEEEGLSIVTNEQGESDLKYNALQLAIQSAAELVDWAPKAIAMLQTGGILWIAYPKKSSGLVTDLTRDHGWTIMKELGFVAVRQISLDATWSSVRFRLQQEQKKPSVFGTDAPGIDRIAKTVTLPPDMHEALSEAGLLEQFGKLAFTHRKEYVVAVLQAKRPETRTSRIQKTVQALAAGIMDK